MSGYSVEYEGGVPSHQEDAEPLEQELDSLVLLPPCVAFTLITGYLLIDGGRAVMVRKISLPTLKISSRIIISRDVDFTTTQLISDKFNTDKKVICIV